MLTIQIEQFERGITFQVHNQTAKITDYVKGHGTFRASNGWKVAIANCPEVDIRAKTVYLRGDNGARDLRVSRNWDLVSNCNRDKYISRVNSALAELAQAVKVNDSKHCTLSQYESVYGWRHRCANSTPSRIQVMYLN